MYYSQFSEDKTLHKIFQKNDGICVEVGANDGVNDSNTYFFERIGWTCVLVEPNPQLCEQIRKVRGARLFECALSSEGGNATLYIAEGADRAHGVSTISSDATVHERIKNYGFTTKPIRVRTRTLDDVLTEMALTNAIDFVSIDVEGHELNVLEGFSIERWKPTIVIVENNSNQEDIKVQKYFGENGYVIFKRTGVNDWYASKTNRSLVNIISWTTYRYLVLRARIKERLKQTHIAKLAGVHK